MKKYKLVKLPRLKLNQFTTTGMYISEDDTYIYTSDGIFNKRWYKKSQENVS